MEDRRNNAAPLNTHGNKRLLLRVRSRVRVPSTNLRDLLKGMTPKAMHEAYDWGPERGREIVDE